MTSKALLNIFLVETAHGIGWKRHVDHLQDNTAAQEQKWRQMLKMIESFLPSFPAVNTTEETAEETAEETDTIQYPSRTRNPPDRYM